MAEKVAVAVAPLLPLLLAMAATTVVTRRLLSPYAYLLALILLMCAHSSRLIPNGVTRLETDNDLPPLPEIEFVAIGPGRSHPLAMRMVDMLADSPEGLQRLGE